MPVPKKTKQNQFFHWKCVVDATAKESWILNILEFILGHTLSHKFYKDLKSRNFPNQYIVLILAENFLIQIGMKNLLNDRSGIISLETIPCGHWH